MKRIKGIFSIFKFKKPIEVRESFDLQLLEKVSALVSSSLEKQVLITAAHPLLQVSAKAKEIAQLSHPQKVFSNIETLLSTKIKESSSSLSTLLKEPNQSTSVSNAEEVLYSQQLFLRSTLYKEYLRRLQLDLSSKEIDSSRLTSDTLLRINDSFLLGNSSERIAEHLRLYSSNIQQFQFQTSMYNLLEPEVHACVSALQVLSTSTPPDVSSIGSTSGVSSSTTVTNTKSSAVTMSSKEQTKQLTKLLKRFTKYSKYYLLDTLDLNTKCRSVFSWTDPNNKDGFKALPDDFSYPVDTVLKSRVLYFSEGSTTSQNMFNGFIANTRILYEEERESRRNFRYGALFIIGTCLLDWYVCIM